MYKQTAVFVDAGYLCMAAGQAAAGQSVQRRHVRLHLKEAIARITAACTELGNGAPLLRIYWYDGCPGGNRKTAEHEEIARWPDVKLRLGTINREGKQKGVDTKLVLDLVELATNRAISDAIILGGDEDLREGVLRAQALGVRVHVVGITCENNNQSQDLLAEADRILLWSTKEAKELVEIVPEPNDARHEARQDSRNESTEQPIDPAIIEAAEEAAGKANLDDIQRYWKLHDNGLPADVDGRLLATARGHLGGRSLNENERKQLRAHHLTLIKKRIAAEKNGAEAEWVQPVETTGSIPETA
jgi:uncharacterized LabA/DUF88 family protein